MLWNRIFKISKLELGFVDAQWERCQWVFLLYNIIVRWGLNRVSSCAALLLGAILIRAIFLC